MPTAETAVECSGWTPTRADRARLAYDAARRLTVKGLDERPQDVMWKRGRP